MKNGEVPSLRKPLLYPLSYGADASTEGSNGHQRHLAHTPPTPKLRDGQASSGRTKDAPLNGSAVDSLLVGLRPPNGAGLYYVLRAEHLPMLKIGFAKSISARLNALQTGCPDRLLLLAWQLGGRAEELDEHQRWRAYHERGEWFRFGRRLAAHVRRLRKLYGAGLPVLNQEAR